MKIRWFVEDYDANGNPDGSNKTFETDGEVPRAGEAVYFTDYSVEVGGLARARYEVAHVGHCIKRDAVDVRETMAEVPGEIVDAGERFEAAVELLRYKGKGEMSHWDREGGRFLCDLQYAEVTLRKVS